MKRILLIYLFLATCIFVSAQSELTGTIVGTDGSWGNNPDATRDAVFDGSTSTYFDGPVADGCWVGLIFDKKYKITSFRFHARNGNAGRMNGGIFQASNTEDFSSGVVELFTIDYTPPVSWENVTIELEDSFQYVRYLSPDGGYGNVAEITFYGLAPGETIVENPKRLGMNLSSVTDWATEFIWVDLARYMRYERKGTTTYDPDQFDEDGFPKYLSGDQVITLGYGNGTNFAWPAGEYHIFYDGEGTIESRTDNETFVSEVAPGHEIWNVTHADDYFMGWQISSTTQGNHLKNLRIIMPGHENTYETDPYHPSFIKHWKEMEAFRFMDYSRTNNSSAVEWSNIPGPTSITQAMAASNGDWVGSSPHLAVEMCNYLKKDAWFCMPHQSSDDCIRKWAEMVRDSLDPTLKVYVEYSNEVWNWLFQQAGYSRDKGRELIDPSINGSLEYFVYRSGEIWDIWEDVFGTDAGRVINVFSWQNNNIGWIGTALNDYMNDPTYNPAGTKPEFLATAPYLGDRTTEETDLDDFFADAFSEDLPYVGNSFFNMKSFADDNNIEYGTYEAGQHYVQGDGTPDQPMDIIYIGANRDARMYDVYMEYLSLWQKNSGGLMMLFNSVGGFGESGSWGALERFDQDTTTAPKYLAIKNYLSDKITVETITVTTEGSATSIDAEGGTLQLYAEVLPAEAEQNITWSVDELTIATVDQNGLLTAISNGTVEVFATSTDGSHVSGSVTLTISNQGQLVETISVSGAGGANTISEYMGTLQCSVTVLPANASNKNVVWSVLPASLATIDQTGLLSASGNGPGTVTVKATAADGSLISDEMTVTLSNQWILVSSISVSAEEGITTLEPEETLKLIATILPENADDKRVNWTSSDESVAVVIPDMGIVEAKGEGTVTIIATAVDGTGITGTIDLTVSFLDNISEKSLSIKVYPNPITNNYLNVSLSEHASGLIQLSLYDISGKEVYAKQVSGQNTIAIPVNDLEKGVYMLQIISENQKECQMIIK